MIKESDVSNWYQYYLKNLQILKSESSVNLRFESISDLDYYIGGFAGQTWPDSEKDRYIATNNRDWLASQILDNGMYFPFIIDDRSNKVIEGEHRLEALKAVGCTSKFLCLATDFAIENRRKIKPVSIYCPVVGIWDFYEPADLSYMWSTNKIRILDTDPQIALVTVGTLNDLHFIITKFGIELGKMTSKLKRQTGITFKGSILIRDEKTWI